MTTDTKAVARWECRVATNGSGRPYVDDMEFETGRYVLFTDHERVVGGLHRSYAVHGQVINDFLEEIETLRTALAASRAEVEGLRKLIPMLKHSGHEWANLSACAAAKRNGYWKRHSLAIASREIAKNKFLSLLKEMERGNV